MKKIIQIVPLMVVGVMMLPQVTHPQRRTITVAIADFRNSTGRFVNDRLQKTVPEVLKTELAQTGAVTVLERSRLEGIFQEQALAQSGVLDAYEAQKVGKLIGAHYVISGEITRAGDRLRIDAHIVSVETGEVVGEKVTGPDEAAVEAMVRILANNIVFNLSGQGHAIQQARVHRYPYVYPLLCAAGAGLGAGWLQHQYRENYDAYRQAGTIDRIVKSYDHANAYFRARNYALGVTTLCLGAGITLWLKNRHHRNLILATGKSQRGDAFVWAPAIDPHHHRIGINIYWMY